MQNIEIKYNLPNPKLLLDYMKITTTVEFKWQHRQKDIYFLVSQGRLKMRLETEKPTFLIEYSRANEAKARISNYSLTPVSDPNSKIVALDKSHGILSTVEKNRRLFLYKNVRIHIDEVKDLGSFMEFESVISEEYDYTVAQNNFNEIVEMVKPFLGEPVAVGYLDLTLQNQSKGKL